MSAAPRGATSPRAAIGCLALFLLPFAAGGAFAATQAFAAFRTGDWTQAGFLAVFALVFGGVGFGGMGAVLVGSRKAEEAIVRQARHPEAPWLWRSDWAAQRVIDSSRGGMWGAWAFTVLWNLISLPSAVLGVRSALTEGRHAALLVLLFPVVGVGLLIWAVRITLRYRRYGESRFELATLPAAVGHTLEGMVRTPPGLRPPDGFHAVLSCIRRVTTGGRNRSTSESVLWQEERRVPGAAIGVPIAFVIPADASPTDPGFSSTRTLWRLELSADVPGVDYSAAFEVPVFRTADSDQPRTAAEQSVAAAFAVAADHRAPSGSKIEVSTTRRGTEIYFPRARNPGVAASITAFTCIWLGALWATIASRAPLLFPIVFGAFGLLLVYAMLDAWLAVARVTAGDGRVVVARGWLTPRSEQVLPGGEIAEVAVKIGGQAGRTAYYDIVLVTAAGKRVTAGGGVRDKREAEWLAASIRAAILPGR
ncbi:MAG TPA: hypothetical protein VMY76_06400 [Gemmatimonadales bacterium]|nr:hypothetical protein [Gemmatimonadales bacterium]